ncbi:hypothetical protein RE9425_32370 [Prescottella equi]|nr:hypothetical protein RE9425_32370 [Prescottella equi]
MSCTRGAANPSQPTRLRLWADSAGYCGNPDCLARLYVVDPEGNDVHFAEAAHVIAASDIGPRGDAAVLEVERGAWSNLILLCANCHRLVDKSPAAYPVDVLLEWKHVRIEKTERGLGVLAFESREEARAAIEQRRLQNRVIHRDLGPDNDYAMNPEAEEARAWKHAVVDTIIPNHRRILRIVHANRHLLTDLEREAVERYRSHVADLEARHVHGRVGMTSRRYPSEIDSI